MKRRTLLIAGALLQGSAFSQPGSQGGVNLADNPYSSLINSARQVIVYVPRLSDGNLVNALKVGMNLGVPIRVLTTNEGMMQANGLILRLVVLGLPVHPVKGGGERRMFMEVEGEGGWSVYNIASGRPVKGRMYDYNAFNEWYGKNISKLPAYLPEGVVTAWTRAHLGYKLTNGSIQYAQPKDPTPPNFTTPPQSTPPRSRP